MASEPITPSVDAEAGFSGAAGSLLPDTRQGLQAQPDNVRAAATQRSLYEILEIAGPPV